MNAATTTFRSLLDKPLNQLTEEDISQLTREDCRKYLKDKGFFFSFSSSFFIFPFLSSPSLRIFRYLKVVKNKAYYFCFVCVYNNK